MIGYSIYRDGDLTWRDNQGGLFLLSPPESTIDYTNEQAAEVLAKSQQFFIRWETDFDMIDNTPWWHIIKDDIETLAALPKKTRYAIRRASEAFVVERISRKLVIEKGYSVYKSAYTRYVTHEKMYDYCDFVSAIKELPDNTEFWAAFRLVDNEMVAFSENYVSKSACFYVSMWFEPKAMKECVGYLLFHEMNKHYLGEREMRYVSDGARSLSHNSNVHHFLESKFGFRKAYARLNVTYVPWLRFIIWVLYPFRKMTRFVPLNVFRKADVIFKQEEIRRRCLLYE